MYAIIDNKKERFPASAELVYQYPSFSLIRLSSPADDIELLDVLDDTRILVNGQSVDIEENVFELNSRRAPHTLIRFAGPINQDWKERLAKQNVAIRFWCPPYGACARIPSQFDHKTFAQEFPFVVGAVSYDQTKCARLLGDTRQTGGFSNLYDIVCFSKEDRLLIENVLNERSIKVLSSSAYKIRIEYDENADALRALNGVKLVDKVRFVISAGFKLDQAIGVTAATEFASSSLKGAGQIIAVADTGLDTGLNNDQMHNDFRDRIRAIVSWPINDSWNPYIKRPGCDDGASDRNSGHGTHVAGCALGSGQLSAGKHSGVAPDAQLVFQSIEQYTEIKQDYSARMSSGYYLNGRPMDIRDLFKQARDYGATIHVNAWGDPANGKYTDDCYETDDFLRKNPDALALFACGNDGEDRDGDGVINKGSLYAPACAKNVIAVGATEGPVAGVGIRGDWSSMDRNNRRFRNYDDRNDRVSGEPDRIALFSSCGPTADGRIKPDLCAPGTNIVGPRSSLISGKGWGLTSPLPYYMYSGGTSISTGIAGGFFALLREVWQKKRGGVAPSGPALKALAILGAKEIINRNSAKKEPSYVGGFGYLHLLNSMPQNDNGRIHLKDDSDPGLLTGEVRRIRFRLKSAFHFKAVIAWYDAPGEALINNLNMCLITPDGKKIYGNHRPAALGVADKTNNVELIDIRQLEAGAYTIEIIARNVPAPPQKFSLAMRLPLPESAPSPDAPGVDANPLPAISKRHISLPVDYLQGAGKAFANKCAQSGINNIEELLGVEDALLKEISGATLYAKLCLLNALTLKRMDTEFTQETTLLDISRYEKNQGAFSEKAWISALPLLCLFDSKRWRQIHLFALFKR